MNIHPRAEEIRDPQPHKAYKKSIPMEESHQPPDHVVLKEPPPMLGDETRSHSHSRSKLTPINQRENNTDTY